MAHEGLTADDVLDLVVDRLPAATQARRTSDTRIGFVLYDAFSVRGDADDYNRGNWGFGVALGPETMVSTVLGQRLTLCGTRDEVRAALEAIDRYARLRLGSEYLEAHATAYGRR